MPTPSTGYAIDGKRIPSVTQVIGIGLGGYSKDALMQWAWKEGKEGRDYKQTRDRAANVGTVAHAMIEAHLHGTPCDLAAFDPDHVAAAAPCFTAFLDWHGQHEIEIFEQEVSLTSRQYRFGGTLDALGRLDDTITLFDWKSSSGLYGSYVCQVAAYIALVTENRPRHKWPRQAVLVRVGKDGTLTVLTFQKAQLQQAWETFLHALAIHDARWDIENMVKPAAEPRTAGPVRLVRGTAS